MPHRYFILNKPANMVSQFVSSDKVNLLSQIDFSFPEGTHAIGRLDKDSEGLLLLTTDKKITRLIFSKEKKHMRTYLVMVRNYVNEETFQLLKSGVVIKIKNGQDYLAKTHSLSRIADPVSLYPLSADFREAYPHTWLLISLTEGKYHQVRKMTLTLRYRCLRLIRLSIENLTIDGIGPGKVKELNMETFYRLAGLK
ncbi:MAG TPA: pseudouridine synthase [Hanamia sp.]|nr:pseudouridine synthase [Hanamia sp.]